MQEQQHAVFSKEVKGRAPVLSRKISALRKEVEDNSLGSLLE
jgi:hypothetical protein